MIMQHDVTLGGEILLSCFVSVFCSCLNAHMLFVPYISCIHKLLNVVFVVVVGFCFLVYFLYFVVFESFCPEKASNHFDPLI